MKKRDIEYIKGLHARGFRALAADLGVTRDELAAHVASVAQIGLCPRCGYDLGEEGEQRGEAEQPERFDPMTGPMDEEVCQ